MTHRYKTKGTCSAYIDLEMDGNIVKDIQFHGGCDGNLKGICSLASGHTYEELKNSLEGIRCGNKNTSCPDQLVRAIEFAMSTPPNM